MTEVPKAWWFRLVVLTDVKRRFHSQSEINECNPDFAPSENRAYFEFLFLPEPDRMT
jgi:hypothetical protein